MTTTIFCTPSARSASTICGTVWPPAIGWPPVIDTKPLASSLNVIGTFAATAWRIASEPECA